MVHADSRAADIARSPRGWARVAGGKLPIVVAIFVASMFVPLQFFVADLRVSPYRALLIATFFPSLFIWLSGRVGPWLWADFFVILLAVWSVIALSVVNGFSETFLRSGFHTLELIGAYFLGRSFVRNAEDLRKIVWILFIGASVMLPFAVYEAMTEHNLLRDLWSRLGATYPDVPHEKRLGLDRVQGPFEHPIHFGVFGASIIGLTYYVLGYRQGVVKRGFLVLSAILVGFFSLSSGPLAAVGVQIGLIAWDAMLRNVKARWMVLAGLTAVAYVVIDVLSNRTPIEVFISYLAFNAQTGYARVLIWHFGWVNALKHPLFGTGFNEWERHFFMTASFDMFWMFYTMTRGILGGFLHVGAFALLMAAVIRRRITDERLRDYRTGWIMSMIGLFMAGWMVHFWNVPFVLFYFLLGAGAFFTYHEAAAAGPACDPVEAPKRPGPAYTRFGTVARPAAGPGAAPEPAPPRGSADPAAGPGATRMTAGGQGGRPASAGNGREGVARAPR